MSLAFILGTSLPHGDPDGAAEFFEASPVVRHAYGKVSKWTGLGVEALLGQLGRSGAEPAGSRLGGLALAAAMFGVHDVLAVKGIRPGVLGGTGLGALVSACLAGALPRQDLVQLLREWDSVTDRSGEGRAESVALAFLPAGHDPEWYRGAAHAGVQPGGSLGMDTSGTYRIRLLTGSRDALDRLAAAAPEGAVQVGPAQGTAGQRPIREEARAALDRHIGRLDFADPVVPVCSCFEPRTLKAAADVRDLFTRSVAGTPDIDAMSRAMHARGTRLGLVLGPSLPRNLVDFPFPVVYVDGPRDTADAIASIFELGVDTAPAAPGVMAGIPRQVPYPDS